ncbi:MAG: 3-oxoadipate enol-lactonase [Deltaproteobacteria bacterium RBG_16_49_23]|nr:MAG: 3-oxoadipate enol-lactonase [Deltaproteobacteria bacterium RBG_16_49_23]
MFATANGIRIHYKLSGRKEGLVVILSHSLASSLKMWDPQMEMLESRFRVLRYDTRGHSRSETTPAPYTLEGLGEDALGLLDQLGMDRVHWVGLSMGGMIGQSIALNHPDRLLSLSLCDTAAVIPAEAQPIWEERIEGVRQRGMSSQLDATMERWFTPSFLSLNPPMLTLIKEELLTTPAEGYIGCAIAIRKLNYLNRLSEIHLPTLIMVGEDDPATPVSASEAIHERIKNSGLIILRSARHLSNVEQPGVFNENLVDFLMNVPNKKEK